MIIASAHLTFLHFPHFKLISQLDFNGEWSKVNGQWAMVNCLDLVT